MPTEPTKRGTGENMNNELLERLVIALENIDQSLQKIAECVGEYNGTSTFNITPEE